MVNLQRGRWTAISLILREPPDLVTAQKTGLSAKPVDQSIIRLREGQPCTCRLVRVCG